MYFRSETFYTSYFTKDILIPIVTQTRLIFTTTNKIKKTHDFVRITIPKVSLNQPLKKKYFFRQGLFFYLKNPTVCVLYLKLTYLSFGLK